MDIVGRVVWWQRHKLLRLARETDSPSMMRRALSVLQLSRGWRATHVADSMGAARSTISTWASWFREDGIAGLTVERRSSVPRTMTTKVLEALAALLDTTPSSFGYLRTRWSSVLLANELLRQVVVSVHPSTVRRALAELDWVWRRARPTLFIADPRKAQRLRAIRIALACSKRGVEVFYQDEADID